jgi:hypothetical protein
MRGALEVFIAGNPCAIVLTTANTARPKIATYTGNNRLKAISNAKITEL